MGFNSVVLTIAIVILVICLVLIGWGIYETVYGSEAKFPPVLSDCPDYWTTSTKKHGDNTLVVCNNTLKMGRGPSKSSNPKCNSFNSGEVSSKCEKLALTRHCAITWDGISDNSALYKECN